MDSSSREYSIERQIHDMVSTSQNYESAQVFELLRVAGWKICEEESKYYAPWSESDNFKSREELLSYIEV
jgi:hypothetical protein